MHLLSGNCVCSHYFQYECDEKHLELIGVSNGSLSNLLQNIVYENIALSLEYMNT